MSYGLSHLKIDIGGTDGNVFVLIAKACSIVEQIEGKEVAKTFRQQCHGQSMSKIGFNWEYEDVLLLIIEKTGITLVASHELPIPSELYTIEANPYL